MTLTLTFDIMQVADHLSMQIYSFLVPFLVVFVTFLFGISLSVPVCLSLSTVSAFSTFTQALILSLSFHLLQPPCIYSMLLTLFFFSCVSLITRGRHRIFKRGGVGGGPEKWVKKTIRASDLSQILKIWAKRVYTPHTPPWIRP